MIGGIVDLLLVVEFAPAGVSGGVDVADVVVMLADPADDVAVHDLHVIDVEQQFQAGRADALDDVDAIVGVVSLVAGVPLHGVRADPGIEHLEAERDPFLLGVADDLLESFDAVVWRPRRREYPRACR